MSQCKDCSIILDEGTSTYREENRGRGEERKGGEGRGRQGKVKHIRTYHSAFQLSCHLLGDSPTPVP